MNTQLRILSWSATGFRCPDHRIDLLADDGTPAPVCLIQMPNGTGKTTTLKLLRAALSGEATQWSPSKLSELQKQSTASAAQPPGHFELRASVGEALLTIHLHVDFEERQAFYRTTMGKGSRDAFLPPDDLRNVLRPDFVKFFVFDGELAGQLLDKQHTKAEGVIDSLFRLDLFGDLQRLTKEYYDEQVKERGGGASQGLVRAMNKRDKLQQRLDDVTRRRKLGWDAIERLREQQRALENQHRAAIEAREEYRTRLSTTTEGRERTRSRVDAKATRLLESMRSPVALCGPLASGMLELMQSLDRVKLPESTAREFFEELADEAECVCGRPLDAEHQAVVRTRAQQYLGSEEMNLLNLLKAGVKEAVGAAPEAPRRQLDEQVEKLSQAVRERREAETEYHRVEKEAADNDPEIAEAQEQLQKLKVKIKEREAAVGRFDEPVQGKPDENSYSINDLSRECKALDTRIAELGQTVKLKSQYEILCGILERAKTRAGDLLKDEVREWTNQRIGQLMPQNRLRVHSIDGCLKLHNPDSERGQAGGSVGETLAVAYAFLATLFNRTRQHDLPFVVDSPAGPLDDAKRRQVAQLVPKLSGQFIAFTINTEQEGFVEPLEEACVAVGKGSPVYRTLFRRGSHSVAEDQGDLSIDGHLVSGRDFFTSFRDQQQPKEKH